MTSGRCTWPMEDWLIIIFTVDLEQLFIRGWLRKGEVEAGFAKPRACENQIGIY